MSEGLEGFEALHPEFKEQDIKAAIHVILLYAARLLH